MLFKKCIHEWEIVTEKFIESNVERAISKMENVTRMKYMSDDLSATHILILKCTKCGELDKTVTRT